VSDAAALSDYVAGLFAHEDDVLAELRAEIPRRGMPEIQVSAEEGRLLQILAAAIGARRILEIGTLGGYSAIWLARALPPDGRLVTLEIDARHAELAREFARRAGLARVITVIIGHALATLEQMNRPDLEPFDLCFIDADKENYPAYLEHALRLVRPGGLILGDNAFLDGRVIDQEDAKPSTLAMREFNRRIAHEPSLASTLIPVRDGLTLSLVHRP
jgi:caffeoyl-CoA O-methyltransferase